VNPDHAATVVLEILLNDLCDVAPHLQSPRLRSWVRAGRVKVEPTARLEPSRTRALPVHRPPGPGVPPRLCRWGLRRKVIQEDLEDSRSRRDLGFHYRDLGSMATSQIPGNRQIGRFRFSGLLAWLGWLALHITVLIASETAFRCWSPGSIPTCCPPPAPAHHTDRLLRMMPRSSSATRHTSALTRDSPRVPDNDSHPSLRPRGSLPSRRYRFVSDTAASDISGTEPGSEALPRR